MATATRETLVIGGGLAGVAAAIAIAERGARVTLLEQDSVLGGRVASWSDTLADGTHFQMERGFHAFFRHYHNVRALLRRVDPTLACLSPVDDYPLIAPRGLVQSFRNLPKRPPFNVIALLLRSPHVRLRDLLGADLQRARSLLAFDQTTSYAELDNVTAKEFLDGLRFPARARQMLFDVFAHSFFNPEDDYSAAELSAMFHFYFTGNAEGLLFDVANRPFATAIREPLERRLTALGVQLELGARALRIEENESGWTVDFERGGVTARAESRDVVLAMNVPGLRQIVASSPALQPLAARADALAVTARFAVLRLWLDRRVAATRPAFAGTTGFALCDNISIYEKLEDESARWARQHGGSVVELHAYGIPDAWSEPDIQVALVADMRAAYPELAAARVVEQRFLVRQDCPAFRPGSHRLRPTVRTGQRGLSLAGDFVQLPFPSALMERAVASGFMAANETLDRLGLPLVEVRHGPLRGLLAARGGRGARQ